MVAHYGPEAVTYPVGDSARRYVLAVWLALVLAGVGVLLLWALPWRGRPLPGAWWCVAVGVGCLSVWGAWQMRALPVGQLSWDPQAFPVGSGWCWDSQAYRRGVALERVEPVLDLQHAQLVRATTVAGLVLWLWLLRGDAPRQWGRLRQALCHGARV